MYSAYGDMCRCSNALEDVTIFSTLGEILVS